MHENEELIHDLNNINGDNVTIESLKLALIQHAETITKRVAESHDALEAQLKSYSTQWLEGQASNERRFKHLEDETAELIEGIKGLRRELKEGDESTRDFAKNIVDNQIMGFRLELATMQNNLQSSVAQASTPVLQELASIKEMLNSQNELGKRRDAEIAELKIHREKGEARLDNFYIDMQDGNERMKLFVRKWDKTMFGDPSDPDDMGVMKMVKESHTFAVNRKRIEGFIFTSPLARRLLYTILGVGGFGGVIKFIELITN